MKHRQEPSQRLPYPLSTLILVKYGTKNLIGYMVFRHKNLIGYMVFRQKSLKTGVLRALGVKEQTLNPPRPQAKAYWG